MKNQRFLHVERYCHFLQLFEIWRWKNTFKKFHVLNSERIEGTSWPEKLCMPMCMDQAELSRKRRAFSFSQCYFPLSSSCSLDFIESKYFCKLHFRRLNRKRRGSHDQILISLAGKIHRRVRDPGLKQFV